VLVLDTNVISELILAKPSPTVIATLARIPTSSLATTAITEAELRFGVARLPYGRRREQLGESIEAALAIDLRGQVLPFDSAAAVAFGELLASRQQDGRPMATFDAMIASICLSVGAALATRNTRHFQDCGIELIDPWSKS
jgi:predicted nucleic acid-binding protein